MHADIDKRFTYHPATKGTSPVFDEIRAEARSYAHYLDVTLPEGREKSLALTKLEEVVFWANAAVARA
jgi:hypothetical protein